MVAVDLHLILVIKSAFYATEYHLLECNVLVRQLAGELSVGFLWRLVSVAGVNCVGER